MSFHHRAAKWASLFIVGILLLAPVEAAVAAGAYDEALEKHLTVDKLRISLIVSSHFRRS